MKGFSGFLRNFGLGLLTIIVLPFLIVLLAIFGVYGMGMWAFYFVKGTFRFFRGEEFFKPLVIDTQVEEVKNEMMVKEMGKDAAAIIQPTPAGPSSVYVQQNYYQNGNGKVPPKAPEPETPIEGRGFYEDNPSLDISSPKSKAIDAPDGAAILKALTQTPLEEGEKPDLLAQNDKGGKGK